MTGGRSGAGASLRSRARNLRRPTGLGTRSPKRGDDRVRQQQHHAQPDEVPRVDEGGRPVGAGQVVVDVLALHDVDGAGDDGGDPGHAGDGPGPRDEEAEDHGHRDDEPRQRWGDEQGGRPAGGTDEEGPREAQPAALALLPGGGRARQRQDGRVEGHRRPLRGLRPGRAA